MSPYKIQIADRNYSNWTILETINFDVVDIKIDPISNKLFSNDVFHLNNNNDVTIIHSSTRQQTDIPGVLILSGNKTYGRNNKGKQYYKCDPDDVRLPSFLIPYEIKNVGFSKVFDNMYVTFSFSSWDNKHPVGVLSKVIGATSDLFNFYEYQLYCKSLNASIQKFHKSTTKAITKYAEENYVDHMRLKYNNLEDRTNQNNWHIFTIDPENSVDLDDGFSIKTIDSDTIMVSIYIANVSIWMDCLNLWETFSRRIATIYLPDKKRPMLPTLLSDNLCSLHANTNRVSFTMDVIIKSDMVIDIKYSNCIINVSKNYHYDDPRLFKDADYKQLFNATKQLSKTYKYISNINNSHDVVSYLMTFMNCHCAKVLIDNKTGIFRSTTMKESYNIPDGVNEEVVKFIKIWNSSSGQYVDGASVLNSNTGTLRHDLLNMDAYIHITSPIRRLVDLLNIIKFQEINNMISLSANAGQFYDNWLKELEYINITMRSIRKIQCDCTLLDICSNNPDTIERNYDGYVFDKIVRNDGLFQYIVYIQELKMSSRITTRENYNNYDMKKVKLFLFNDESRFKRKIRLQIL